MKIFDNWMEAQQNQKYWADQERKLRLKICEDLLEGKSVGTHNIKKGKYKIKVVKKVNHNLDNDILSTIWDDLTDDEKESVKFEPSLLLKVYNELEDTEIIDQAITVKPAMPTLSIEYIEAE